MNKNTKSKLILAELGQIITMTPDEFIESGGWIEESHIPTYYLGHTMPNIHVILTNDVGISTSIPIIRHFLTVNNEEIYSSESIDKTKFPLISNYETIPIKRLAKSL